MKFKTSSILIALILVGTSFCAYSDDNFDVPGALKASDVLPADLIKNEYFSVRDEVTWFDGLNEFTVDTEYGSFKIWGEPMLRVRLHEFIAWSTLNEISTTEAGAKAIGDILIVEPAEDLLMAFSHPILTIKGVPQGISRLFTRVIDNIDEVVEALTDNKDEDPGKLNRHEGDDTSRLTKTAEALIGVNSSYRRMAEETGVNPYTTNVALREQLERVAKVDAVLRSSTKLLKPKTPEKINVLVKVSKWVYKDSWRELVEHNRKSLSELGLSPELTEQFLLHDFINLSLATVIVESLNELTDVEDRSNVIKQAMLLETESEAVWFAESVLMAQWFHKNEAPLARMLFETLVPVGLTKDGRVIVFSSADIAYWDESTALIASQFTSTYDKYSDQREVWVADQVSERFVEGLGELGWSVRSGIRGTVLPEIPWGLEDDGS